MKHPQEEVDILSEGFTKFTSTIDQVKSSKSILLKALSDIEKIEHTYFRTRIARENNVVRRTRTSSDRLTTNRQTACGSRARARRIARCAGTCTRIEADYRVLGP